MRFLERISFPSIGTDVSRGMTADLAIEADGLQAALAGSLRASRSGRLSPLRWAETIGRTAIHSLVTDRTELQAVLVRIWWTVGCRSVVLDLNLGSRSVNLLA